MALRTPLRQNGAMCRFLAYLGAPIDLAHLVYGGAHPLFEQAWAPKELLRGPPKADGYGVVWYADGRPARLAEPRPLWQDPGLERTLSAISAGCVLAALQNHSPGTIADRAGLLPLVLERWSFVLDGFVPDFGQRHMRALRTALPDELYAELRGASAAETLFLLALSELRRGASPAEALQATARTVCDRLGRTEAQLNMVLCDGTALAVVRTGTALMTNSLYVAQRPPFAPDGVVVASEAIEPGACWSAVDGHSWMELAADGDVRGEVLD